MSGPEATMSMQCYLLHFLSLGIWGQDPVILSVAVSSSRYTSSAYCLHTYEVISLQSW